MGTPERKEYHVAGTVAEEDVRALVAAVPAALHYRPLSGAPTQQFCMPADPFNPELLCAFAHFSRRFPGLTLEGFRELWDEADAFMDDALQLGYKPSEVPGLLRTDPYLISD